MPELGGLELPSISSLNREGDNFVFNSFLFAVLWHFIWYVIGICLCLPVFTPVEDLLPYWYVRFISCCIIPGDIVLNRVEKLLVKL